VALENLILDGRIQPPKIEELMKKRKKKSQIIKKREQRFTNAASSILTAYRRYHRAFISHQLWTKCFATFHRNGALAHVAEELGAMLRLRKRELWYTISEKRSTTKCKDSH